ncbi:oligosaccharide flippase family protein [Kineococcus indalonis]|uniref:oligosaccharide flippase family protein n=1 Tax=Kineococcus indalonis TaxID=2696566 RepID=UPI00141253F9|nr:oligosaccharide flippase family protein [Kineococcus indalonis]NAZ87718.1 oligosaccharide flippase family protein [Kineococcus indalonis]
MTEPEPDHVLRGARLARVGVAAALVSRVFGRLVGIVLVVVLARVSDPTTVALYGFLLGTVTLTASVTDLGVASLAGRDVAAGTAAAPAALRSALGPQALSAGLAVVLTCLLALLAGPAGVDAAVLVPCSAFVVANATFNLWAEVLRGAGRAVLEGLLQGASALLLVVAGSLAVLGGAGIVPLLWIVAGKELVVLLVAAVFLRPGGGSPDGPSFGALVRRSAWLAVAGTALIVLWRQGTVLVSALAPTRVLADYVVATRFLDAAVTLAHTLGIGLFPAIAALAHRDRRSARRQAQRYLGVVAAASVALAVLGVLLAGPVTTLLFGERWGSAVLTVRVLAAAAPFTVTGYLLWFALLAEEQERWLCLAAAAAAVTALSATAALLVAAPSAAAGAAGTGAGAVVLVVLLGVRYVLTRPRGPVLRRSAVPEDAGRGA